MRNGKAMIVHGAKVSKRRVYGKKNSGYFGRWGSRLVFMDRHSAVIANAFLYRRYLHFFPW